MTHAGYFEGIGGFSLAAEWLGIETVYTCEIDDFRHNWLTKRFVNAKHERDITKTKGCAADIFTAGFPCQDVSSANTRGKGIEGERSGLWHEMYRIVKRRRPKYLLLENSPRLIHKGLNTILGQLAAIGYDAEWNILSKQAIGFKDVRKRLFIIAYPNKIGRLPNISIFNRKSYENGIKALGGQKRLLNQSDGVGSLEIRSVPIPELLSSDAGLPEELVASEIMAYGDAVCPHIAFLAMHMIVQYDKIIQ